MIEKLIYPERSWSYGTPRFICYANFSATYRARWQHELPELTKPQYAVMRKY